MLMLMMIAVLGYTRESGAVGVRHYGDYTELDSIGFRWTVWD